jgi:GDP/UDP-N,N'-diacetylbacillosamine 2-epimerase (hydrolysing)
MALAQIGIAEALDDLKPDILMVLGDRYETLAAAISSLIMRIPVGHIHGGETTEGSIDDYFRHAITKLSSLHFVSTNEYRETVIQMGESPSFVNLVGGLGVDSALRCPILSSTELSKSLGLEWMRHSMLVTFHPVTTESANESLLQMRELLSSLQNFPEFSIIITRPNADQWNSELNVEIDSFVNNNKNAKVFSSLGSQRYLSCMAQVDVIVGNSSSALLETPSFCKPAVNVGSRQKGRIRGVNVIDCLPVANQITDSIRKAISPEFSKIIQGMRNPFGDGNAGEKIARILTETDLTVLRNKKFHRLPQIR